MADDVLDLVAALLTIIWLPSMLGCLYLWRVYLDARTRAPGQWLLQMLAVTSVPPTIAVTYISFAAYMRLIGDPIPQPAATVASVALCVILAFPVPYKALRIYMTTHGHTAQPSVPITKEGSNGS